jgi:hypothetical protein
MVAENLFFNFQSPNFEVDSSNVLELLGVLRSFSKTMISSGEGKEALFEREKKEIFTPTSRLLLSFIASIQKGPQNFDPDRCRRLLADQWENGNFNPVLYFLIFKIMCGVF